eukprot:4851832-Pyramimonas_sp.AAC.1
MGPISADGAWSNGRGGALRWQMMRPLSGLTTRASLACRASLQCEKVRMIRESTVTGGKQTAVHVPAHPPE